MLGEGRISNKEHDRDSGTEEVENEEEGFDGDEVGPEEGDDLEDEEESDEDDFEADLEDSEEKIDDAVEADENSDEDKETREDRMSGNEISSLNSSGRNRKHIVFDEDEDFDNVGIPACKVLEQTEESESEDSDAVPEESAISKSKIESARQEKKAQEEVQRVRNKIREKRKKQHERNKKQKDEKRRRLEKLTSKRLPSDLLEKVEEDMASRAKGEETGPALGWKKIVQKEASNKHKFFKEEAAVDDGLEDGKESNLSDTEDVISLKKGVQVRSIKSEENKYQALSKRAINFRQRMLYGKRQDRVPSHQLHEMKVKQEKSGKAKLVL